MSFGYFFIIIICLFVCWQVVAHTPCSPSNVGSPQHSTDAHRLRHMLMNETPAPTLNMSQLSVSTASSGGSVVRYRGLLADKILGTPRGRATPARQLPPHTASRLPSLTEQLSPEPQDEAISSANSSVFASPCVKPPSFADFRLEPKALSEGGYG